MRKYSIACLSSLATLLAAGIVLGQVHAAAPAQSSASRPATAPAPDPTALVTPASQPAALPPLPPADHSGIVPTTLPAVKQSVEHTQAWQKAIQGVMERIEDPQLRQQLSEGLGDLAPQIARGLIDHRGDTAFATVAVYRQAGEGGKQAAVALAFEGFGGRLDATFYGRVLADMPRPPDAADNAAPRELVLDSSASCYLCFFLSANGLCAGAIPHETFKQELAAAFLKTGATPPDVVADGEPAVQEAAIHEWLDQGVRQGVIQQQQAQLAAEEAQAASASYGPGYDSGAAAVEAYPPYYYGDWGLYGAGWYNPIIIVLHHPLHHDGDCHHWHDWNWKPYNTTPRPHPSGNSVVARPPLTSDETASTRAPRPKPVSTSNAPAEPSPQPVWRQPVRQPAVSPSNPPVQPAAPPRSSGSAPSGGARGNGGASGGSHAAGSSGTAGHSGGSAAHK